MRCRKDLIFVDNSNMAVRIIVIAKKYNLIEERFGKLIVIRETENPNSKRKRTYWQCECDCGENTIVSTTDLLSTKTQQCWNCAHKDSGSAKRKSILGNRYGKLTVVKEIYGEKTKTGKHVTKCECICDCGNILKRSRDSLVASQLPSCGCAKKESVRNAVGTNVSGVKFGRLTVIETIWDETPVKLRCLCDCGNEYIGVKSQITYGQTQSCGCLQRDRASEVNEKDWTDYISDYGVKFISQHSKNQSGQWLWLCKCGLCDSEFIALPAKINNGHITSCGCKIKSKMEQYVLKTLEDINFECASQYSFSDCIYKYKLKFDFAVLNKGSPICLIECDGEQHYKPIDYFGGEEAYKFNVIRDEIKNTYCKDNNIPLLRLPYFLTNEEIKQQILRILNDCGMPMVT